MPLSSFWELSAFASAEWPPGLAAQQPFEVAHPLLEPAQLGNGNDLVIGADVEVEILKEALELARAKKPILLSHSPHPGDTP